MGGGDPNPPSPSPFVQEGLTLPYRTQNRIFSDKNILKDITKASAKNLRKIVESLLIKDSDFEFLLLERLRFCYLKIGWHLLLRQLADEKMVEKGRGWWED